MKQTMRIWLALILALCAGTTAWGYDLKTASAPTGYTVAFSVGDNTNVSEANKDDVVTVTVTSAENAKVGDVTAKGYMGTGSMQVRTRTNSIDFLDIQLAEVDNSRQTVETNKEQVQFTFTMPAANVEITVLENIPLSSCTITLNPDTYEYDGTAKQPEVSVTYGSTPLVAGTDYTLVGYTNNTDAGAADDATAPTVTIEAVEGTIYSGTATKTFTISPKSIDGATVTLRQGSSNVGDNTYTYDGTAKEPTAIVKLGKKTLTAGTDYTISYANNTNAGTATATATIVGQGNYSGGPSKTFTIKKANSALAFATRSLTKQYSDSKFTNAVTVNSGDGTVSYRSSNTSVATVDAETGEVTIQGTGSATIYASITEGTNYKKRDDAAYYSLNVRGISLSTATFGLSQTSYEYDGTAKQPTVYNAELGSTILTEGVDYTVSYYANTNAGEATVYISAKTGSNYEGSAYMTFTIRPKQLSSTTVADIADQTYTGEALTPAVTVKDGSKTLASGTAYTVSYANNTNVGTATATISGKGNYTGNVTKNFSITKADITPTAPTAVEGLVYTGQAQELVAVGTAEGGQMLYSLDGTTYTSALPTATEVGEYTVYYKVTGDQNHNDVAAKSLTVTIGKKALEAAMITAISEQTYTGGPLKPAVEVKDGEKVLAAGTDYEVAYANNTEAGTATVTITGKGNFTGEAQTTFTIVNTATPDTDDEASVTIGATGKTTYTGSRDLDFTGSSAQAYIAVGYDATAKELTLARVYKVPAGTPILIKGAEGVNEIPFTTGVSYIYQNMFAGNTTGKTIEIGETDGDLTNYALKSGEFKAVNTNAFIPTGKAYLQMPTTYPSPRAGSSLTVKLSASGKTTLCAAVDLDFTGFSDMYAYAATAYNVSEKRVMLSRVLKASAGTPLILKGKTNGTYTIPSAGVQTTFKNMFVGNNSGAAITVGETSGSLVNYYLTGGQFKAVNGSLTVNDGKCYLQLPASAAARTRGTVFDDFDIEENNDILVIRLDGEGTETTGMEGLLKAAAEQDVYYNLNGQRTDKPGKGVYVKGGRKVIVK